MALSVEKGTFTKTTTTTGLPFTQQINLVDSGLTPKAIILWSNGLTTTNTFTENYEFTYGFSDGTNDVCQQITVEDNDTACVASYSFNNNCILSQCNTATPTAGTQVSRADLSAFGAGSFTLNWTVQSDTTAKVIHYMVLGGSDIENVSVFQTTVGDTSTGNHSFNGSGTTFTPNFALTQTGSNAYATINSLSVGTISGASSFNIGAAKDTTHEWCICANTEDAATTSDTYMNLHNNACLMANVVTTGAENFLADFVSFNSAAGGGITVNVSNAAGASTQIVAFMLMKIAATSLVDVDTFQQRSGTGTQDITLTSGHDPQLVGLTGIHNATANATQNQNYICVGGSDGTREGCTWCGDQDSAATMINTRKNLSTEKVFTQCTPAATAGSSTTDSEADMNDMATIGKFQLNWSTASATLGQMAYWAIGRNARVTKDLILKWNTIARVTKDLILKWNTIARVTKALILKWNTEARVTKDLILKWNIEAGLERVTKNLILKWNTVGRVTKNVILKWNIIQFITKNLTLKWNTIGRVTKDLILKWNTIGRVTKDLTLKWNTIGRVTKALILKWNIQERITKDLILKWNTQVRVTKDLILKWNTIERVTKNLILKWNTIGRITKDLILKWNTVGRVTKNLILKWNTVGRITKNLILKWDIMEAGLERVTKDVILKWNTIGRTTKNTILKWNTNERITKSLTLKWNIIGRITKSLILKWNVIGRTTKNVILKWNTIGRITKTLILKWNIESTLERVTKTLTLKWNIVGRTTKNLILKWNILSEARTIIFPGQEPSYPINSEGTRTSAEGKRRSPNWWRNFWYR